uniref:Glycosyltransferase n=1 Tax=viral metagenome TaxID=1070528 RepID=A0A6M3K6I1_9ZZZZ
MRKTMKCKHASGNRCLIAERIAGVRATTRTDKACKHCLVSSAPRAKNAVTASLAIAAMRASGDHDGAVKLLHESRPWLEGNGLKITGDTPSLIGRVLSWKEAIKRWNAAGRPVRSDEEVAWILREHCQPCEHYSPKRKQCKICGCFSRAKGMPEFNKPKMATEKCPLEPPKWGTDSLPTMVVVAGPNRTGTSCVAGMLHSLGVSMGEAFIPTTWQNPKGYYEEATLERFLFASPGRHMTAEQITEWFRAWSLQRRESPMVGCKHPKLCNMLPYMARVWPSLKVIATNRPLDDAADSLERAKWGGQRRRGGLQRLYRQREADLGKLRIPVLPLEYRDIIQNPVATVEEIIWFLGITPTAEQRRAAIAHVDPTLCHINPPNNGNGRVDVVYPLSNGSKWENNEIRYSLRSLEKHATNLGRVFVVTDKLPSWMRNVVHVKVLDQKGRNKDANIIDKIRAAIKAGMSERFVFASDDQYLIAPVDLSTLPVSFANPSGKGKWWKRWEHTAEHLHAAGKPAVFYESHLFQPHLASQFEHSVADTDYSTNPGYTVNSLAYNKYEPVPHSVPRRALAGVFMDNYGEAPPDHKRQAMAERFPTPSSYERGPNAIACPRVFTFWTGPKPPIIELCLDSMRRNIPDIEVWTQEHWAQAYDGSVGPWRAIVHRRPNVQSDYLRYWLLSTYGGIWLDADYIAFRDIRGVWDQSADYIGYLHRESTPIPYTALMGGHPDSPIVQKQVELARTMLGRKRIGINAGPRLTLRALRACPNARTTMIPRKYIHPLWWQRGDEPWRPSDTAREFNFEQDAYGLMLLGSVVKAYRHLGAKELLEHPSVVGQAFRRAME